MIEVEHLTKEIRGTRVLDDLGFRVEAGEVYGLLGPNGAGKTTTIRILAGLVQPTAGAARVCGLDPGAQADAIRARTGTLVEQPGLYPKLTAHEYLRFFGEIAGLTAAETRRRADDLLERFGLAGDADRRLGGFSLGMRQKVSLVRALLHEPEVLLLDEPTAALDAHSARGLLELVGDLCRERGRTALVCTHHLLEAEGYCDRLAILSAGRIVAEGTRDDLERVAGSEILVELRLAEPGAAPDRALAVLAGLEGVEPVERAFALSPGATLGYRTADPDGTGPAVVRALVEAGLGVISVVPVRTSLKDLYFQALENAGDPPVSPDGGETGPPPAPGGDA